MPTTRPRTQAANRVIGIRHALLVLKNAGLVESGTNYPKEAVKDLHSVMLALSERWYMIGAKRGARAVLDAFRNGELEVGFGKNFNRIIVKNTESIAWEKCLNVTVGNRKTKLAKRAYEINTNRWICRVRRY